MRVQPVWRRRARAVCASVALTVLLAGCALFDRHSQLTIATVIQDDGSAADVTTNPVDITESACDDEIRCVEAYSTDEANYYRFASRDDAAEYAAALDDGFVVHYIVMNFAGKHESSPEHQQWAMERLAGTWQDYDGPFPDR